MKEFDWPEFWMGALRSLEKNHSEKEWRKIIKIIGDWSFEFHKSTAKMNCFKCEFLDEEKYPGEYWCSGLNGVTLTPERECSLYEQIKATSPKEVR